MAKKSAKSKGYRKTSGKKPYLSKRDIIILCVLIAVIAVGAILLFSYDDGALKTRDGKLVDAGENWLVINGAASGGRRYYKIGEVGEIEGYTRAADAVLTDENLSLYRFTPDAEDSPITSITVSGSPAGASRLAEYYAAMVSALEPTAVATAAAGDVEYSYFTYRNEYYAPDTEAVDEDEPAEALSEPEDTEAAEDAEIAEETAEDAAETVGEPADETAEDDRPAPNHFEQAINAYADAAHNGSVAVTVICDVASAEDYLDDDALRDAVAQAIAAVTFEH